MTRMRTTRKWQVSGNNPKPLDTQAEHNPMSIVASGDAAIFCAPVLQADPTHRANIPIMTKALSGETAATPNMLVKLGIICLALDASVDGKFPPGS